METEMTHGTPGTGQLLFSLFTSHGYTATIARCMCLRNPLSNSALQILREGRTSLALKSVLITLYEIFYGELPRASEGREEEIRSPSPYPHYHCLVMGHWKNVTAKCLCHGTAKLRSSAPSPINVIAASSPAYTGLTLRMERRVAGVHTNSQLHHRCVCAVSVHLLSEDSDPLQISTAIYGFSTCLSGASQGDCERDNTDCQVQREGKMPITQAPQKHFCPREDIGLMCSFCRFNSLDTPISSCYHVF